MNNDTLKVKARHMTTLFPNKGKILGGGTDNFGIVKWTVLEILDGDGEQAGNVITVTGTYSQKIDPRKEYTLLCKETQHKVYGKQYQLLYINEVLDFSQIDNQRGFLRSFLSDGQIDSIYAITDNPLKVISEHDMETLVKSWGIGEYIANAIFERFENMKDYCQIYLELDSYGLTPAFIQKLIHRYNSPQKVIDIVKQDPYRLCFDCDGIGFKTADKIALSGGLDEKSVDRVKGYIFTLLKEEGENGNSYLTSRQLTSSIFNAFGGMSNIYREYNADDPDHCKDNNIAEAIYLLEQDGSISIEENVDKANRKVYLNSYFNLEKKIADELHRIQTADNNFQFDAWEEKVAEQEREQGWKLTDEQVAGVRLCLENQVCLITGASGTGKTSVLSCVLKALNCMGTDIMYSFTQCSLSGKAAARMSEVTGAEGSTIHRLLGFSPYRGFTYNSENQLSYDVIVVDEISLIGGHIFLSLCEAIASGSKLIILGDMGQLESIGCMNLAHDLFVSDTIPTVTLSKIHRQAQKSGIITVSKSIREQEKIFSNTYSGVEVVGEYQDMVLDIAQERESTTDRALGHYKTLYQQLLQDGFSMMDIQVLTSVKSRGNSCVQKLNNALQEIVNPTKSLNQKELQIAFGASQSEKNFCFREGDKVMCIRNNYNVKTVDDEETEIFNGWTGILQSIDMANNTGTIYFPISKKSVILSLGELREDIILGYASTVHKFQGSQCRYIIGVCDYSTPPNMLTKELLYTMITRAEKYCVLVGQNKAISAAIRNSTISIKQTFLVDLLAI